MLPYSSPWEIPGDGHFEAPSCCRCGKGLGQPPATACDSFQQVEVELGVMFVTGQLRISRDR